MGEALFALLADQTTAEARVFPLLLPNPVELPASSYQQISATPLHAMGVTSTLTRIRVQINAWGTTYAQARTLANEVRATIERFRGAAGGAVVGDILLDNEMEQYERETNTRRVIQDFTVLHTA